MSGPAQLLAKIPAREWRGLVPKWLGGRLQFPLVCHICENTDHWSAAQMISPQAAIPKIIQIGWDVNGKLTCPACVAMKKRSTLKTAEPKMTNKQQPAKATGNWRDLASSLSDDQRRKNKRIVIAALEDYYDDVASAYREGKSDKGVATELDLAEGFVQEVREELFGSIKPPSEMQALLTEMVELQMGLDNLKLRVDAVIVKQGWKE